MDFHLKTERFDLRPVTIDDLEAVKRVLADPDVVKMLLGNVSTPEGLKHEAKKWIDGQAFWNEHGLGSWGVFDRDGSFGEKGGLIGIAAASPPGAPGAQGPEIFYFFVKRSWGKGVAFEAVGCMCRFLFESLPIEAIEASIFAEVNPGSVRLAGKLGMAPAGRVALRDHGMDEHWMRDIANFDLWRLRTAAREELDRAAEEAPFRIGQLCAEDFDSREALLDEVMDALSKNPASHKEAQERAEQRLDEGIAAPGLALYRVDRMTFEDQAKRSRLIV